MKSAVHVASASRNGRPSGLAPSRSVPAALGAAVPPSRPPCRSSGRRDDTPSAWLPQGSVRLRPTPTADISVAVRATRVRLRRDAARCTRRQASVFACLARHHLSPRSLFVDCSPSLPACDTSCSPVRTRYRSLAHAASARRVSGEQGRTTDRLQRPGREVIPAGRS